MRAARAAIFLYLCTQAAWCDILVRNVTVIDVKAGARIPRQSLLIRGKRIAAVGPAPIAAANARIVDGTGKFAIPGLWDMHVHLLNAPDALGQFVAWGVTGVRDMGSELALVRRWRARIDAGERIGPRIESCGAPVDGFPPEHPGLPIVVVRSPNEARAAFDLLDNQRVDFIGVLDRLPRDAYFALAERARKWYSTVAGRVPGEVSAVEAVEARQKSLDRMDGILLACSAEERKLAAARALAIERRDWPAFSNLEARAAETFDAQKAGALFRRMALYETREVPMLVSLRVSACCAAQYERLAEMARRMSRAGVGLMAGTGAGISGGAPGLDLHRELQALVDAGLTPLEALRTATLEPARFLNAEESLGSLEAGKFADVVLLEADPLADIRNTRRIAGVVARGTYVPASAVRK